MAGCIRDPIPVEIRFPDLYMPEPNSGCWLWMGSVGVNGYGRTKVNGKYLSAHRLSFELHVGAIPLGFYVLHKCDNKSCVNPLHLYAGTQLENMRDMVKRGRHYNGKNKR